MAKAQEPLYVGTNGFVAALDPGTGEELWRTKLPKCGGIGAPVVMLIKGQQLFAAAGGRAWCLDRRTGSVIWQNGLPKMGYHVVLLAMEGACTGTSQAAAAAAYVQQCQQQHAAAGAGAGAAM